VTIVEAEHRVLNMVPGQVLDSDDAEALREVLRHRDHLRQLAEASARLLEVPTAGRVAGSIGKGSGV
jgi:hypothetical protein